MGLFVALPIRRVELIGPGPASSVDTDIRRLILQRRCQLGAPLVALSASPYLAASHPHPHSAALTSTVRERRRSSIRSDLVMGQIIREDRAAIDRTRPCA
jgi:hypothetical protein